MGFSIAVRYSTFIGWIGIGRPTSISNSWLKYMRKKRKKWFWNSIEWLTLKISETDMFHTEFIWQQKLIKYVNITLSLVWHVSWAPRQQECVLIHSFSFVRYFWWTSWKNIFAIQNHFLNIDQQTKHYCLCMWMEFVNIFRNDCCFFFLLGSASLTFNGRSKSLNGLGVHPCKNSQN